MIYSYFSITKKIKNIKDLDFDNKDEDINIENNLISVNKIYEFIDKQIIEVNKKIKEMNDIYKYSIDKLNKKLDLYINLNNVILLKYKKPNNLSNKQINILTNHDFSIPLINKYSERNKIRMKTKDNSSLINPKDIKDINDNYQIPNSSKILSIIEPYLIKKFKNNSTSTGGNNK